LTVELELKLENDYRKLKARKEREFQGVRYERRDERDGAAEDVRYYNEHQRSLVGYLRNNQHYDWGCEGDRGNNYYANSSAPYHSANSSHNLRAAGISTYDIHGAGHDKESTRATVSAGADHGRRPALTDWGASSRERDAERNGGLDGEKKEELSVEQGM
jgi:hypothetical protein